MVDTSCLPSTGREGSLEDALRLLKGSADKGDVFANRPTTQLPWKAETSLPECEPSVVFSALVCDKSRFDLNWHQANGDTDIQTPAWTQEEGKEWGGVRLLTMTITAGSLGKQKYREDQRFAFVTSGGVNTLLWQRSGRLQKPPMMVPKFRVQAAYIFQWAAGGGLTMRTYSGITGYNGWLRGRLESDCKADFRKAQPRFEGAVRTALQKVIDSASHLSPTAPGGPSVSGIRQQYMIDRENRSSRIFHSFSSCGTLEDIIPGGGEPIGPIPDEVPSDDQLEGMPLAELIALATMISRGCGLCTAEAPLAEALKEQLIEHLRAAPSRRTSHKTRSPQMSISKRSPQVSAMEGVDADSADTFHEIEDQSDTESSFKSLHEECLVLSFDHPPPELERSSTHLEKANLGQLLDLAQRYGVYSSEISKYRAGVLLRLQTHRDEHEVAGAEGVLSDNLAVQTVLPPRKQDPECCSSCCIM